MGASLVENARRRINTGGYIITRSRTSNPKLLLAIPIRIMFSKINQSENIKNLSVLANLNTATSLPLRNRATITRRIPSAEAKPASDPFTSHGNGRTSRSGDSAILDVRLTPGLNPDPSS